MYYNKLFKDFKKDSFAPIYLFYGHEHYIVDHLIDYIKEQKVSKDYFDFNFHQFDFDEEGVDALISKCQTLPFVDQHTFIVVKDAYCFNKTIDKNSQQRLLEYFENPNQKTVVMFIANQVSKRRKIVKAVKKTGEVVELRKLNRKELNKWISKYIHTKELKISNKNLNYLINNLDYTDKNSTKDLYFLSKELDKLCDYAANSEAITSEAIDEIIEKPLANDIFKLVDSIALSNSEEAIIVLNGLYYSGEPLLKVLYMITRQFRLIYKMKILIDSGMTPKNAGNLLNLHSYVAQKVSNQSKNFTLEMLQEILDACVTIDKKIKTTSIDNKLLIENFLGELFFLVNQEKY
jgi:DNA polymerase-3 subunit delta